MFKELKNFIKKIQKSDLQTRKKWLFIFSVVFVILIVIFWRIYLGFVFKDFSLQNDKQNNIFSSFKKEFEIFKKGLSEIKKDIENQLGKNIEVIEKNLNKGESLEINNTSTQIFKEILNVTSTVSTSSINDTSTNTSTNF